MKAYRKDAEQRIIKEQAAHWLCELADGEPGQQAAFVAWLKRSPRHVGEFLMASMAWKEFGRAGVMDMADIEKIVAAAKTQDISNVVTLPAEAGTGQLGLRRDEEVLPNRRRWIARIAAAVAIVTVGAISITRLVSGSHTYTTDVGEQRSVRLADGSLLHLNTDSRVAVRLSEQTREVRLLAGEALFTVERDPTRPFSVYAGGTVIRALGTQFDVYRHSTGVMVSVVEGLVEISKDNASSPESARLGASEQATIAGDGKISKRAAPNIAKALAWRERRLVFQDDRLEDIAAEVNRYTAKHMRLKGESVRGKRITGTFNADDPQSLVLFLKKLDELAVETDGDGFLVRERTPTY